MAQADDVNPGAARAAGAGDRTATRRTLSALAAISLFSLLVRTFQLGVRTFHWDEGRVGYWILRYHASGQFHYRPIIHGPFVQHANHLLFTVLPPTDFVARLPVALVTAALPLSVWLLRDHLDDVELVALGLLLTLDPILLYYSRFMRSDMLVGTFAFVAFACLVRAYDARDVRLLYPAAVALALAFASKENALVYVLCFAGAAALVYDHRLVRAVRAGESAVARLKRDLRGARREADRLAGDASPFWWAVGNLSGAGLCFLAVTVLMYAPRPELWQAFAHPAQFPAVVEAATLGAWDRFSDLWLGGSFREHPYFSFLHDMLETLVYGSAVLCLLAAVGFVADGYAGRRRPLVAYATYWGVVSVFGYPIATDIQAPWTAVHALLPLAIPAAAGVGAVVATGRTALEAEDAVGALLAGLLLTTAVVGVVGANAAYWNSASEEDKQVLQWAQPDNELKETLETVAAVSRANEGEDVLFYGTQAPSSGNVQLYVKNESSLRQPPPGGPAWHSRLPLPWYLERAGANVTSTAPETPPSEALADAPPVVIAMGWDESEVGQQLSGYDVHRHDFKLWGEEIVIFIDRSAPRAS